MAKITKKIAVVVTILNEKKNLSGLLQSFNDQIQKPSEVVIVDGGSTDGSLQTLKNFKPHGFTFRFYVHPSNRSEGRNYGVSKTRSAIIVFTDAGCIPDKNWIQEITTPFFNTDTQIVSGYYYGLPQSAFETCLVPYVLVMPDKASKAKPFLPSTRSMAISRFLWDQTGGFNPSLNFSEDFEFAFRLAVAKVSFYFQPTAKVGWLPRKDYKSAAIMFFNFARSDILAGIIRPKVKYLIYRYVFVTFLLFLSIETRSLLGFQTIIGLFLIYTLWAIIKNFKYTKVWQSIYYLPLIQYLSDFSVLIGTMTGFITKIYGI